MRIDAHQHFWLFDAERDNWIDESMALLRHDFLPGDLKPLLEQQGFDGCVAVQASESFSETDFLLALSVEHDWIKKVVGWLDLRSAAIEAELERLSGQTRLAGFRQVIQHLDPQVMDDNRFRTGLAQLQAQDFTYDLLIYPRHLPTARRLVRDFPQQRFVIDHLAKPMIRNAQLQDWSIEIRTIAQHDNVVCKLSGLVTEASWHHWTYEQLRPCLDLALEVFGPQRLMFGSDWPVALLAGSYAEVHGVIERFIGECSAAEKSRIMGGTACEFYRIAG